MDMTEHRLPDLPNNLLDIDLAPDGYYVGILGDEHQQILLFGEKQIPLPEFEQFPKVRIIDKERALIIRARADDKRKANAWVIERTGRITASFFIGDGIQDVLVCGDHMAVTYFDEGVFSGIRPSEQGLVAFDFAGNLTFEYQNEFGSDAVEISDCYCACVADSGRLFFSAYEGFPLVELNLKERKQIVYPIPRCLHGSSALSIRNGIAYFFSPYFRKNKFFSFEMETLEAKPCGQYVGRLRGLQGGKFLARGESGYSIISLDLP